MLRSASTDELYFVTLTVTDWIDVFTRRMYSDFIIENLAHCQQHKKLNIYEYVIMTNDIHLVANVTDGSLGDVLGNFKTYTSKRLSEMIANNTQVSRRDWMIKAFEQAGKYNPLNKNHQFWQNGNYPLLLYTPAVIDQKIDYIHENPVRAGFVGSAHEYWYSSANPESPLKYFIRDIACPMPARDRPARALSVSSREQRVCKRQGIQRGNGNTSVNQPISLTRFHKAISRCSLQP